ncbi:MAG: BON domain-containing protein [Candidatus Contendobacter sp.]|nr:BON domain-containing protein [Candidatus Contendobacter sp.]
MNRLCRLVFVTLGVLLALTMNGCAGLLVGGAATGITVVHDRRTAGTVIDDQTVELKLQDALNQQLPPGNHISVTSYNGAVLLTGQVLSMPVRQQAEDIARRSDPPVREVYNELVISPPLPLSVQSNDAFLTTKVKASLFQINDLPDFDPTRVKVVTENGTVYLLGLVYPVEADAAAGVASQVAGVRQVVTIFEYIN